MMRQIKNLVFFPGVIPFTARLSFGSKFVFVMLNTASYAEHPSITQGCEIFFGGGRGKGEGRSVG